MMSGQTPTLLPTLLESCLRIDNNVLFLASKECKTALDRTYQRLIAPVSCLFLKMCPILFQSKMMLCSGILKNKQGAVSIAVFHFLLDTEVV